jgi:hypothetical protein
VHWKDFLAWLNIFLFQTTWTFSWALILLLLQWFSQTKNLIHLYHDVAIRWSKDDIPLLLVSQYSCSVYGCGVLKVYRAVKLWHISGSKRTKTLLKYSHNLFLQLILYQQQSDIWTENPAMKKEVRKISMLTLFNLDPQVVFHTNDVTLNSFIAKVFEMGQH